MFAKPAVLGALAILAVAGCGGDDEEQSTAPSGASGVTIKETEFALAPATVDVAKAGTVTLTVANAGKVTHALEIEGNGLEEKKTGDIEPGASAKLTVDLKPGSYELYCPIDDHKGRGMEGKLTVAG